MMFLENNEQKVFGQRDPFSFGNRLKCCELREFDDDNDDNNNNININTHFPLPIKHGKSDPVTGPVWPRVWVEV